MVGKPGLFPLLFVLGRVWRREAPALGDEVNDASREKQRKAKRKDEELQRLETSAFAL